MIARGSGSAGSDAGFTFTVWPWITESSVVSGSALRVAGGTERWRALRSFSSVLELTALADAALGKADGATGGVEVAFDEDEANEGVLTDLPDARF